MPKLSDFFGKSVLVTGAGKGIGYALAHLLAQRGAQVVTLTRSRADLDRLASEIGATGIALDLADVGATQQALAALLPVDLLVNCAGTTAVEPFVDLSLENLDLLYAVNVRAPMLIAQAYARDRIAQKRPGAIVNVSSVASFVGIAEHAAYCASKGALDAMGRVMANELGRHGIRVNAVNPVVTLTPMAVKVWSAPEKSAPMLERIPLQHFAHPDEVCEVILFLLSDAASMVNGISMPVDGGFLVN